MLLFIKEDVSFEERKSLSEKVRLFASYVVVVFVGVLMVMVMGVGRWC